MRKTKIQAPGGLPPLPLSLLLEVLEEELLYPRLAMRGVEPGVVVQPAERMTPTAEPRGGDGRDMQGKERHNSAARCAAKPSRMLRR